MAVYKDKYPLKKGKKLPGEVRPGESALAKKRKKKPSDKKTKPVKKNKDIVPPKSRVKPPVKGVLKSFAGKVIKKAPAVIAASAVVSAVPDVFRFLFPKKDPWQASEKLLKTQKLLTKTIEKAESPFDPMDKQPIKERKTSSGVRPQGLKALRGLLRPEKEKPTPTPTPTPVSVSAEKKVATTKPPVVKPGGIDHAKIEKLLMGQLEEAKAKAKKPVAGKSEYEKISTSGKGKTSKVPVRGQTPTELYTRITKTSPLNKGKGKPRSERGKADIVSQFIANLTGYRYTPGGGESAVPIKHYPKGERGPTGFTAYPPGWEPKKKKKKRNSSKSTMGYE